MEPVWMTLGQIAGLASAVAAWQRTTVTNIGPAPLPAKLKVRTDFYA